MRILTGQEIETAMQHMLEAVAQAKQSTCQKAFCGSVIAINGSIIGKGFNSPAGGEPNRCSDSYSIPPDNKHDITCCAHAEIRALHDATKNNPQKIQGSTLYFIRLDKAHGITHASAPYCTLCSREALDSGIKEFVLWHKEGITAYDTQEYNNLSYQFYKDQSLWQLK